MLKKILLALGVVVTISALGSALTCNYCVYTSEQPKAKQMCGNQTVNCTTLYCYTATYTINSTVVVVRDCDDPDDPKDKFCPNADETCRSKTGKNNLTSCAGACCTTDNCNNYTPSSAKYTTTPSSANYTTTPSSANYTTTPSSANYTTTPSSAYGVMATKSILCLMAIVGFLFA